MDSSAQLFEPGEKVMYPQFGLGTIAGVTNKQVNGASLSFYRLEFPLKQMEILVPVKRAAENGLRRVMTTREVAEILEYVSCAPPSAKPQQWHRWRKKTLEQLKSGDPLEIAKIYCYLQSLEGKKGLSFTERKILLQVERMLISEIAVAKQISEADVERVIERKKRAQAAARAKVNANGRTVAKVNGSAGSNGDGRAHGAKAKVSANGSSRTAKANGGADGSSRTAKANGSGNGNGGAAKANGHAAVAKATRGTRRVSSTQASSSRAASRASGKAAG